MSIGRRILKFLASLKLAVFVILGLAVISAVGTIKEAQTMDAEVAQKLVYHSWWMYFILGLLIVNLVAVMVDRWPWKQHHAGFVLAHIGIIILLFGSWVTAEFGVDGSMAFNIGEENQYVTIKDRDLSVWASLGGENMQNMYEAEVDFLTHPPTPEKPYVINLGQDELKVVEYHHFAFRESEIVPSTVEADPGAIRFHLVNANVSMTEWLRVDRSRGDNSLDLGPAQVVLARSMPGPSGKNEILLVPNKDGKTLNYTIYNKDYTLRKKGVIKQSDVIDTGWMGLQFRLLRYLPHAKEILKFTPTKAFTPTTTSAARLQFRGEDHWIGLNSILRIYLEDRAFIISYGLRRLSVGFPLRLIEFRMGKYQGTERAASYESEVYVPEKGEVTISMNNPLKHNGFTFYQASFERDMKGNPVVSILSVNHDPGRWIKYLGSLLIVLGSIILFYFKRVKWLKAGGPQ